MDDSALRLVSEIGTQLAQQTRPNKDFLVKSLRVSPIPSCISLLHLFCSSDFVAHLVSERFFVLDSTMSQFWRFNLSRFCFFIRVLVISSDFFFAKSCKGFLRNLGKHIIEEFLRR